MTHVFAVGLDGERGGVFNALAADLVGGLELDGEFAALGKIMVGRDVGVRIETYAPNGVRLPELGGTIELLIAQGSNAAALSGGIARVDVVAGSTCLERVFKKQL